MPSCLPTAPGEGLFLRGKGGWDELVWVCLPLLAVDSFFSIRFPGADPLLQLQSPEMMQELLGLQIPSGKWNIQDRPEPIPICASPVRSPQSLVSDSSQTPLLQAGARGDRTCSFWRSGILPWRRVENMDTEFGGRLYKESQSHGIVPVGKDL